ncbi:V-set and immunoglobulin domain-containing protein 10-like [Etheostoma cragini]|uniref:V-set and immunoglobulin domain-containing protein 10-like n=1 Tax=Etheostoma cragini TaxID=417921 RepID=UPI00155E7E38|nr:V-set and immunoglobulin domain-containing protein 10-like [Etheostoma cragini]
MTWPDDFGRINAGFLTILLSFTFQGAYCELVVSPVGPTLVNAICGSNVTLAVSFSGAPDPAVTWFMKGFSLPVVTWTINSKTLPDIDENRRKVLRIEPNGSLTFVNVPLEYTSNYTIEMTKSGLGRSSATFTLEVFSSPVNFLPAVGTRVDSEGKIVVAIQCVSEAWPKAVVSWSKGSEALTNGTTHQISSDTTQLEILGYNVSKSLLQIYFCNCSNPLGSQRRDILLTGPSISNSSLFSNHNGTIVTLTWEVPPTSVVTGFDIQMKGPDLLGKNHTQASLNGFYTIQHELGTTRSADIFVLDPNLTYMFRIIPKALKAEGDPSTVHRVGPGEGLSRSAIAGIAAGIPSGIVFLVLLGGFVYFCVQWNKNKSRQTRYPLSKTVEKAKTSQTETTPPNLLTGGLRSPPDYNRLQQTPSERSMALPIFGTPLPVRIATTV